MSELLGSVQQDEGEQRAAEEQHALSDTINTGSTLGGALGGALGDTISTVTQVPLTA